MTGNRNGKVRENLLKEKNLTLQKAVDIAHAAESTVLQIKVMSSESGLFAVKEQGKGQSDWSPVVTKSRIKDCRFCGRSHERRNCPAFGQISAYCKKKNHFVAKCPAETKVSAVQERFYLSVAGVSGGDRDMVTLTVFKDAKSTTGYEIAF